MTLGGVGVVEPIGKKMSQLDCYAFHEPGRLVSLPAAAFSPWFVALLIFPLVQVQVNFSLKIHRYKAQIRGRSFFYKAKAPHIYHFYNSNHFAPWITSPSAPKCARAQPPGRSATATALMARNWIKMASSGL